jgi:hypothetical protein
VSDITVLCSICSTFQKMRQTLSGQAHGQMGHLVAMYATYRPRLCHPNQCLPAPSDIT